MNRLPARHQPPSLQRKFADAAHALQPGRHQPPIKWYHPPSTWNQMLSAILKTRLCPLVRIRLRRLLTCLRMKIDFAFFAFAPSCATCAGTPHGGNCRCVQHRLQKQAAVTCLSPRALQRQKQLQLPRGARPARLNRKTQMTKHFPFACRDTRC